MRRSTRRLIVFIALLPVTLVLVGVLYQLGMAHLEDKERSLWESISWAGESITTTGYGADSRWDHPVMQVFVIGVQFMGVVLTFLVFPVFFIPFIEERFEGRLPSKLPRVTGFVLIHRWGPAVSPLVSELERHRIPVVILESDITVARRLHDRGRTVVHVNLDQEDSVLDDLGTARGIVGNGSDHANAVLTLMARQSGFTGPIVVLVDTPTRRAPMMRIGATAVFTPRHVLAAAMAAKVSQKISPEMAGEQRLGKALEIAQLRVHRGSSLVGKTLAEADVRATAGATIIAAWIGGELHAPLSPHRALESGTILVAAGSHEAVARLGELTTPVARRGHFVVVGQNETAHKIVQFLSDAEEQVRTVEDTRGVDGGQTGVDPLDPRVLREAGVETAQAVLVALDTDSETTFAAAVIRDLVSDAAVIACVDDADHVARVHKAGADFVLSIGQVAGQLLMFQLLGEEAVSLQPEIKLAKSAAGKLAGTRLLAARIRERTGCLVIAVERGDEIIVDFPRDFTILADDHLYVSGTPATIATYFETFPGTRA
jgi:Trk K+ transport system NAD-binding subunit